MAGNGEAGQGADKGKSSDPGNGGDRGSDRTPEKKGTGPRPDSSSSGSSDQNVESRTDSESPPDAKRLQTDIWKSRVDISTLKNRISVQRDEEVFRTHETDLDGTDGPDNSNEDAQKAAEDAETQTTPELFSVEWVRDVVGEMTSQDWEQLECYISGLRENESVESAAEDAENLDVARDGWGETWEESTSTALPSTPPTEETGEPYVVKIPEAPTQTTLVERVNKIWLEPESRTLDQSTKWQPAVFNEDSSDDEFIEPESPVKEQQENVYQLLKLASEIAQQALWDAMASHWPKMHRSLYIEGPHEPRFGGIDMDRDGFTAVPPMPVVNGICVAPPGIVPDQMSVTRNLRNAVCHFHHLNSHKVDEHLAQGQGLAVVLGDEAKAFAIRRLRNVLQWEATLVHAEIECMAARKYEALKAYQKVEDVYERGIRDLSDAERFITDPWARHVDRLKAAATQRFNESQRSEQPWPAHHQRLFIGVRHDYYTSREVHGPDHVLRLHGNVLWRATKLWGRFYTKVGELRRRPVLYSRNFEFAEQERARLRGGSVDGHGITRARATLLSENVVLQPLNGY